MDYICLTCVHNIYLRNTLKKTVWTELEVCIECRTRKQSISFGDLAEVVNPVFRKVFASVDQDSLGVLQARNPTARGFTLNEALRKLLGDGFRHRSSLIQELIKLQPKANYYDSSLRYFFYGVNGARARSTVLGKWKNLNDSVKHTQRFFNEEIRTQFEYLFEKLEDLKEATVRGSTATQRAAVTKIKKGTLLYRARIIRSSSEVKKFYEDPDRELGPPGPGKAGNGRMNAPGITVLYTAKYRSTAHAELRPSLGVSVASAQFKTTRTLKILDFRVLEKATYSRIGNYFHPNYFLDKDRASTLRQLHHLITLPVNPQNESDYLITQMMAEYLSQIHPLKFDGIRFSSAQAKDKENIVLFRARDASEAQNLDKKYGVAVVPGSVEVHNTAAVSYKFEEQPPPFDVF